MAVYEKRGSAGAIRHTEIHLYGSSRLGILKELTKNPVNITVANAPAGAKVITFTRGEKFFELSNHLGNVLAVIADKKLPVKAIADNSINFWLADVVTATSYYPFGMAMPGRTGYTSQSTWVPGRGFVAGTDYPDYLGVSSRPYRRQPGVYLAVREVELLPGFESFTGTDEFTIETAQTTTNGQYVLSTDYAGGQGSYESYGYYRYGFNGKENDNEVKGSGNQQDYGMRIYDNRLGRFLSGDPLTQEYPWYTPYQFSGNSPILFIDRDGLEPERNKKSPGLPEIYGRYIALEIANNVTNRFVSIQQRFWFSPVKEPELKGRYVCGLGTGFISDTRQDKARMFNMFVGTNTQFFVDESNASEYKDYEAAVNYSIMKGFVTGTGPENYVFPRNGVISSTFLKSDVLKDALQNYLKDPGSQYGPEQSEFGMIALGKDAFRNGTLFGSVTGLVGSAQITITPSISSNGINIDIFNVTSITSGAFGKEFYKAIFGDVGEMLLYPRSYVREPGATTEFGNVSQRFSLFIPFSTEGDKYSNVRKVIANGNYEDE